MTLKAKEATVNDTIDFIKVRCQTLGDAHQIASSVAGAFFKTITEVGENQSIELCKYNISA